MSLHPDQPHQNFQPPSGGSSPYPTGPVAGVPNGYGGPYQPVNIAPDHPNATLVLVLAILGYLLNPLPLAPIALIVGTRARNDILRRGQPYVWGGTLKVGWILSIVATILFALVAFFIIFVIAVALLESGSSVSDYSTSSSI